MTPAKVLEADRAKRDLPARKPQYGRTGARECLRVRIHFFSASIERRDRIPWKPDCDSMNGYLRFTSNAFPDCEKTAICPRTGTHDGVTRLRCGEKFLQDLLR